MEITEKSAETTIEQVGAVKITTESFDDGTIYIDQHEPGGAMHCIEVMYENREKLALAIYPSLGRVKEINEVLLAACIKQKALMDKAELVDEDLNKAIQKATGK